MGWKKWRVCQLHEARHNQEKTILMAKDTRYFPIQGAGSYLWYFTTNSNKFL